MRSGLALSESKTSAGHALAKHALETLTRYYPGYTWYVRADYGILDIKCSEIGKASMIRRIKDIDYNWTIFDKDIIMSGGEFLERAKLRRGTSEDVFAKSLDGGEKIKWQPRIF